MKDFRERSKIRLGKVADGATRWIGSTSSIIVHTVLFAFSFGLYFFGFDFDKILLVVTTLVSLEAIYLAIFIQMSVNKQAQDLDEVAQDVEDIQEDVEEIQEDIDEIQEDVEDIQEDVEDIQEDEDQEDTHHANDDKVLGRIEETLGKLIEEINELKKNSKKD
jgi:uncharacterized protein YlxW (UPF0749 family)